MSKSRIFLGSSGKQEKLLQADTRSRRRRARGTLDDILQSWDHHTGERLLELAHEVVRYGEATTPTEMRAVNQKLRKAIENEGRVARIEGLWWQFSLTERSPREPSAVSLLRISRDRDGGLELGAEKSSVHDHGPCWVVHGNYRNPTRMRRWRRDDGRRPRHAEMEPHREFREYALVGPTGGER